MLERDETSEQNLGDGQIRREFALSVAAYEPGDVELPAVEVTYLGKRARCRRAHRRRSPIKIASLIANEPEPALKDTAPPVPVMEQNLLPLYIAGGLLAAGWARSSRC